MVIDLFEGILETAIVAVLASLIVVASGFRRSWTDAWISAQRKIDGVSVLVIAAGLGTFALVVSLAVAEGIPDGH